MTLWLSLRAWSLYRVPTRWNALNSLRRVDVETGQVLQLHIAMITPP
jgi:hypothetical protein